MDHGEVKTVWDLLAYIAEHRAAIFVSVEGRTIALAEMADELAFAWVKEFGMRWLFGGWMPTMVLPVAGDDG